METFSVAPVIEAKPTTQVPSIAMALAKTTDGSQNAQRAPSNSVVILQDRIHEAPEEAPTLSHQPAQTPAAIAKSLKDLSYSHGITLTEKKRARNEWHVDIQTPFSIRIFRGQIEIAEFKEFKPMTLDEFPALVVKAKAIASGTNPPKLPSASSQERSLQEDVYALRNKLETQYDQLCSGALLEECERLRAVLPSKTQSGDKEITLQAEVDKLQAELHQSRGYVNQLLNQSRGLTNQVEQLEVDRAKHNQRYASLLKHIQPSHHVEGEEVVTRFRRLNSSIEGAFQTISDGIRRTLDVSYDVPSNSVNLSTLRPFIPNATSLVASLQGAGRPMDSFLEFSLRHIINETLCYKLFDTFHPQITVEQNLIISELKNQIRSQDPQLVAAKWRSSTFTALDIQFKPADWIGATAAEIIQKFMSIVQAYPSPKTHSTVVETLRPIIVDIVTKAHRLNRDMKVLCLSLDFHALIYNESHKFDGQIMKCMTGHPLVLPSSGHIITSVNIAWKSSESYGKEKGLAFVTQEMAEVITEGYFVN